MRRSLRENCVAVAGAAVGIACIAWLGLTDFWWNDYDLEASASVHQLVTGHLLVFLQQAPAYGGSLLLRAPFALAPGLWGGGPLAVYRMLALPCLVATAALAVWLVSQQRAHGDGRLARGTAMGLLVANPAILYALEMGHAEEILAGALAVAAVLVAGSARWIWAAVLLGLAVATKSWALVAVAPVICALPRRRVSALLTSGAIAAAVLAPFLLAQHLGSVKSGLGVTVSSTGAIFHPQQLWWFLGHTHAGMRDGYGRTLPVGYRGIPGWLSPLTHPLIVLVSPLLSLLWSRRGRRGAGDALALLTLVLMLRCLLDPWDNYYYCVPFLIALTVWEGRYCRVVPLWALVATIVSWAAFQKLPANAAPDLRAAVYLSVMVPAVAALSLWLFAPRTWSRLKSMIGRDALLLSRSSGAAVLDPAG